MLIARTNDNGGVDYVELTPEEFSALEAQRLTDFEASWLHKDRPLRVFMCDSDYLDLIKSYPPFALYPKEKGIPLEETPGGQHLYLLELFDEHRQMFEMYDSTVIETYSPQP